MTLQNRVSPFGELHAFPARGLFLGNRGGRFHDDAQCCGVRRWASNRWICCRLDFKNRKRSVWSTSYTELFFLDELTALGAGHRPCFECRRKDAEAFAALWGMAYCLRARAYADEMDRVLHCERLHGRAKRLHRLNVDILPDGTFIAFDNEAYAIRGEALLRWTPQGYDVRKSRPSHTAVDVLTPPSILAVLAAGYRPHWHPSARA